MSWVSWLVRSCSEKREGESKATKKQPDRLGGARIGEVAVSSANSATRRRKKTSSASGAGAMFMMALKLIYYSAVVVVVATCGEESDRR